MISVLLFAGMFSWLWRRNEIVGNVFLECVAIMIRDALKFAKVDF